MKWETSQGEPRGVAQSGAKEKTMKATLLVMSLALIAHQNGVGELLVSPAEALPSGAVLALECDQGEQKQRDECVDRYERAFSSGETDPLAVLRMHCTRWQNAWDKDSSEPPSLCVEHFGGWVRS
jgi:hypothetical protein